MPASSYLARKERRKIQIPILRAYFIYPYVHLSEERPTTKWKPDKLTVCNWGSMQKTIKDIEQRNTILLTINHTNYWQQQATFTARRQQQTLLYYSIFILYVELMTFMNN